MDKLSGVESDTFDVKAFRSFCTGLLSKENISPRENHAFMTIFTGILVAQQFEKFNMSSYAAARCTNEKKTSLGTLRFYNYSI